jgi:hypothetical protein
MCCAELENGYEKAYENFYSWSSILKAAQKQETTLAQIRHLAYTIGWKKCEKLWALIVKSHQVKRMIPLLEAILGSAGPKKSKKRTHTLPQMPRIPTQPALSA